MAETNLMSKWISEENSVARVAKYHQSIEIRNTTQTVSINSFARNNEVPIATRLRPYAHREFRNVLHVTLSYRSSRS